MKLIYLHGPPASGKFTIASELEARIGAVNFHNHLTIDVVRPLFEFGTQEFWDLLDELRLACLRAIARKPSGVFVHTCCYDHPSDLESFEQIESLVLNSGSTLLPVYLHCPQSELEERVSSPSRIEMKKISSVEELRSTLRRWNCIAVPRENCLTISTNGKTPAQCAEEIIEVLRLNS